jgi:hypothetical protein
MVGGINQKIGDIFSGNDEADAVYPIEKNNRGFYSIKLGEVT